MGRRTVFVVGAGASHEFGFPIGSELASAIRNKVDAQFAETPGQEATGPLRKAFEAMVSPEEVTPAARALRAGIGANESIDHFLFRRRTRPAVRELGMLAIADVILDAERLSNLNQFDPLDFDRSVGALRITHNSWVAVLLDLLVADRGPHEIDASLFDDVAFLIFNYDRCVEHLLFNHLNFRHDIPVDQAIAMVETIPMQHIFGVLGDPFKGPVPFGVTSAELRMVAKRLQTYHEEITDAARQAAINAIMADAEKVCFLGFGFLPENFERLFPGNEIGTRRLFGTSMNCDWSPAFKKAEASNASQFVSCNPTMFLRSHGEELMKPAWF